MKLYAMLALAAAVLAASSGAVASAGSEGEILFAGVASEKLGVYSLPATGGTPTVVAHTSLGIIDPTLSPDGTRIAFAECQAACPLRAASTGGEYRAGLVSSAIFVMSADGTGATRITPWGYETTSPTWSPDGSRIAFSTYKPIGNPHVWVVNVDGSGLARLTATARADAEPAWSPDGTQLALIGPGGLDVLTLAGGDVRRLKSAVTAENPVWSPDGKQIAFDALPGKSGVHDNQIFVVGADGSGLAQVTRGAGDKLFPAWSPDGTHIAFVACGASKVRNRYMCGGDTASIESVATSGGKVNILLGSSKLVPSFLSWR